MRRLIVPLLLIGSMGGFAAELTLAPVFSDHMVLQREQPVPVWGTADPGSVVTVEFRGQRKSAVANFSNHWKINLDPLLASSTPWKMTVSCNHQSEIINRQFSDVLVGDVWLCSGQSNMEWPLKNTDNAASAIASANRPFLRMFTVPRTFASDPQETGGGFWQVSSPETVGDVSAVAYYFGRTLQQDLDVPVGLIISAWGGSLIEPWIPGLESPGLNRQDPSVLYNAMIHPYISFAIRGVIWYQGESNRYDGMAYADKARALIEGWRNRWDADFPFYLVQIAPFQYKIEDPAILPAFWEAQSAITKTVPKTGMVVISDCAALDTIHPRHKEPVGVRLAHLAEADEYGMNVISSGPVFQCLDLSDSESAFGIPQKKQPEGGRQKTGETMIVHFNDAEGLTTRDGNAPNWFEIAGPDGVFKQASAQIEGSSVVLNCDSISDPVSVRFAWHKTAVPNLINGAGWPAGAFRAGEVLRPPKGIVPLPEASGFRELFQAELPVDPDKGKVVCNVDRRGEILSYSRIALCLEQEVLKSGSRQYFFAAMDRPENILLKDGLSGLDGLQISARNAVFRSNIEPFASLSESTSGIIHVLPGIQGLSVNDQIFGGEDTVYRFRKLTVLVK